MMTMMTRRKAKVRVMMVVVDVRVRCMVAVDVRVRCMVAVDVRVRCMVKMNGGSSRPAPTSKPEKR